jgi:hypothetical protein
MAGAALSIGFGCDATPQDDARALLLHEIRSWTLETGRQLIGAEVRGDTAFFWSADGRVGVLEPERQTEVVLDGDLRLVGGMLDGGHLVVVSGEPVQILDWDPRSPARQPPSTRVSISLRREHTVSGAVKGDAWYVHVVDLDNETSQVVRVANAGQETVQAYDVPVVMGRSHNERVLVVPRRHPEWIDEVTGKVVRRHPVPELASLAAWRLARGQAVVVQVVPLDRGEHLMTIADLGSDQRWLARLDHGWRVLNTLNVVGPIGVVASDTITGRVLMSRVLGDHELVLYEWRRERE